MEVYLYDFKHYLTLQRHFSFSHKSSVFKERYVKMTHTILYQDSVLFMKKQIAFLKKSPLIL